MKRPFARYIPAILAIPAAIVAVSAATSLAGSPVAGSQTAAVPIASDGREQVAVFAGGCFWGVEAVFEHLKGVKSATSGYAGGTVASPNYEQVSSGTTGHAESVRVVYDPSVISYQQLLDVFFNVAHDPTELNRQGPDVGTQYRSIVFYSDESQKKAAEAYVAKLTAAKTFPAPIVTEIVPLGKFYEAEAYHQHYMAHHPYQPYIVFNDAPKVAHLKKAFPVLYQEPAVD